jgi:hypothetical protein
MAPRPFLNIQAGIPPHEDAAAHWAHYTGNHGGCRAIYRLLGAEDRLEFLKTTAAHAFPASARTHMVEWFREHLRVRADMKLPCWRAHPENIRAAAMGLNRGSDETEDRLRFRESL